MDEGKIRRTPTWKSPHKTPMSFVSFYGLAPRMRGPEYLLVPDHADVLLLRAVAAGSQADMKLPRCTAHFFG